MNKNELHNDVLNSKYVYSIQLEIFRSQLVFKEDNSKWGILTLIHEKMRRIQEC